MLGEGAVARGLVAYFGLLFNVPLSDIIVEVNGVTLDFLALTFVLIMTVALCFGMKESSLFLTCANITALFFFIFTGIAAFSKSRADYFADDFLPNGADGLFQSFAILTFSYTGFDAICNAVEEVRVAMPYIVRIDVIDSCCVALTSGKGHTRYPQSHHVDRWDQWSYLCLLVAVSFIPCDRTRVASMQRFSYRKPCAMQCPKLCKSL